MRAIIRLIQSIKIYFVILCFYYTTYSILQFLFHMNIQNQPHIDLFSSPFHPYKHTTPPTQYSQHPIHSHDYPQLKSISQFTTEMQTNQISKLMENTTLEEKQNQKQHTTDRFIPLRKHSAVETINPYPFIQEEKEPSLRGQEVKEDKVTLDQMYRCILLDKNTSKMFHFNGPQSSLDLNIKTAITQRTQKQLFKGDSLLIQNKLQRKASDPEYRKISRIPFKVLDAPNLQDDFYLNLLEWSSQNILSVALDSCLYFWNANNNRVVKFCDLNPDSISSINWNQPGSQIAVGTSKGTIQLWDATKNCKLNEFYGHSARVSSVAWTDNLLASGSRDRTILLRDVRERRNKIVTKYEGHTQQVCGLKWSFDGNLLASGGNDNKLFIWSAHSSTPICKFSNHCAAVKGIAWSPHNHGVLASGGGSADKTIKFWNTLDNTLLDSIDTGSQVCNLMFSKNTKEIVSTHGYSNNEIIVWKYPSLQKMTTLTGHSSRVLFLAMNPTGETIVTGAGDQTLRFWNVFPGKTKKENRSQMLSTMDLR